VSMTSRRLLPKVCRFIRSRSAVRHAHGLLTKIIARKANLQSVMDVCPWLSRILKPFLFAAA
jgi:hypothetical protein